MIWFYLLIGTIATYRATRLIIVDEIFSGLRNRVFNLNIDKLTYLITCPWCISIWAGLFFALLYVTFLPGFTFLALAFTFSAITGILFEKL